MNRERLGKLVDHLFYGKLIHKEFTLKVFNSNSPNDYHHFGEDNICGTYGCAIRECPAVFPEDWIFNKKGGLTLLSSTSKSFDRDTDDYAMEFFDLDWDEYKYLFFPRSYKNEELKDKIAVANRIICVIENGFPEEIYE